MFNLILFGPPGSGKGTQAARIAEKFNFAHISTGEIFRSEIKNKTELGLKVQSIIESGELVPDELLIQILESALDKQASKKGIIFDGFPRTKQQAYDLEDLMKKRSDNVNLVLGLDVDDDEIIERLLKRAEMEGRKDDTEDVIRNRLQVYNNQTKPLINYYKVQEKYASITGLGSIDEIFDSICGVVENRL